MAVKNNSFEKPNEESKQHINLSTHAFSVIDNDMFCFNVNQKSTFLNRIISNFYKDAKASISIFKNKQLSKYQSILTSIEDDKKDLIINKLLEDEIKQIKDRSYPKGVSLKFRINKENLEYLTEECNEADYYSNIGKYLKALIEEYCELPLFRREQIFFKEYFDTAKLAIEARKILKLRIGKGDGTICYINPFQLITNNSSTYNYIVGYKCDNNNHSKKVSIISYRLSHIQNIKILHEKAFLSADSKKEILTTIKEKGTEFVNEEIIEVHIKLTKKGIDMYNSILHLRPQYEDIIDNDDNTKTYIFKSTNFHIENYFLKFGANAIIISPEKLKKTFKKHYKNAFRAYN